MGVFYYFSQLPLELRCLIWKHPRLPSRRQRIPSSLLGQAHHVPNRPAADHRIRQQRVSAGRAGTGTQVGTARDD
jgi:hypothetical protein